MTDNQPNAAVPMLPGDRRNDAIIKKLLAAGRIGPQSKHGVTVDEMRAALEAAEPGTHLSKIYHDMARLRLFRSRIASRPTKAQKGT